MVKIKLSVLIIVLTFFSIDIFGRGDSVDASENSKDVDVPIIYYHSKKVVSDPTYIIAIPSKLSFSKLNERIDTTVSLFDTQGRFYQGENKVSLTVTSKNKFNLVNKDEFQDIRYQLIKYAHETSGTTSTIITNNAPSLGELSKTNPRIKSEAILGSSSVKPSIVGNYEDILTYSYSVAE
ncbi:hypothetical protein IGJ02_000110 [Enterococcus sp. DIV0724b]